MKASILNREFQHPADGWYMIEAKGTHPNAEAGVVQVIDDAATQQIVNRFNADADAGTLRHGHEMLIDHEHFGAQSDKESRAYGWLTMLENRADGIYGQVRWTATGKAAVDGGDYRFFSTEYAPEDLKPVKNRGAKHVRPVRLDGLTLTNMNNNRGQKPITNKEFRREPCGSAAGNEQTNKRTMMKTVATKLGLSAEASEEAILAEVTKVMNRATEAEGKVTPLQSRVSELETANGALLGEQVDALLDAHGIKSDAPVRNRLKPVLQGLKNREERTAALKDFGFVAGKPQEKQAGQAQNKLFNRDTKPPGSAAEQDGDKAEEQAKANKIMNRACELQKQMPNMSTATAFGMAQREMETAN